MNISIDGIDNGNSFDWGKTSNDYAKYRDIYPEKFYQNLLSHGIGTEGQHVLDIGTGTGVLPRNMYKYGAKWAGTDISENQIIQAKRLATEAGMNIEFSAVPSEAINYPDESFDAITACQCIWYFDHKTVSPNLHRMLKKGGKLALLYMAWLPFEDKIANASEELVLKYSPEWNGAREIRKPMWVPDEYLEHFDITCREQYDVNIPFTRETWNGRMKACRGVSASLTEDKVKEWEIEHIKLLSEIAPEEFEILHHVAVAILTKKS